MRIFLNKQTMGLFIISDGNYVNLIQSGVLVNPPALCWTLVELERSRIFEELQ